MQAAQGARGSTEKLGKRSHHEDKSVGSRNKRHELSIGVLVIQDLQLLLTLLGCSLPPDCIVPHLHHAQSELTCFVL